MLDPEEVLLDPKEVVLVSVVLAGELVLEPEEVVLVAEAVLELDDELGVLR